MVDVERENPVVEEFIGYIIKARIDNVIQINIDSESDLISFDIKSPVVYYDQGAGSWLLCKAGHKR